MLDFSEMFKAHGPHKLNFWIFLASLTITYILAADFVSEILQRICLSEHIVALAILVFRRKHCSLLPCQFFVASPSPAKHSPKLTVEERRNQNQDIAIIIPCHEQITLSESASHVMEQQQKMAGHSDVITTTVRACLEHVKPSQIFVVDNGNQSTPLDDTEQVLRQTCPPEVNYLWNPVGNKTLAQYAGLVAAKEYKYLCLIDDDVTLPDDLRFDVTVMSDRVKAICYPIQAIHPERRCTAFIEWQWQDIEYKLIDFAKTVQSKYSTVLFPHGAISLWDHNILFRVLRDHDTVFYADDVKMGKWLQRHVYDLHFEPSVLVDTEAPTSLFGPAPNFWCQRVRSWDMVEHVYCWDNLQHLILCVICNAIVERAIISGDNRPIRPNQHLPPLPTYVV